MKYAAVALTAFLATALARPYDVNVDAEQVVTKYVTQDYVVTVDANQDAAPSSFTPPGPPDAALLATPAPSISKHRHHHHHRSSQPLETSSPYAIASQASLQQNLQAFPQPDTPPVPEYSPEAVAPAAVPETAEDAKPSKAPESSNSGTNDDFSKSILDLHNKLRAKHSAPALTWSDTLAKYASDYLKTDNCVFKHSNGKYGENIAMGYNSPADAVQAWYDEVKSYDYSAGQFSMSTGHFTQIVWKGTTELGCAQVQCGSSGAFLLCSYNPPGNMVGDFQKNVVSS